MQSCVHWRIDIAINSKLCFYDSHFILLIWIKYTELCFGIRYLSNYFCIASCYSEQNKFTLLLFNLCVKKHCIQLRYTSIVILNLVSKNHLILVKQ